MSRESKLKMMNNRICYDLWRSNSLWREQREDLENRSREGNYTVIFSSQTMI